MRHVAEPSETLKSKWHFPDLLKTQRLRCCTTLNIKKTRFRFAQCTIFEFLFPDMFKIQLLRFYKTFKIKKTFSRFAQETYCWTLQTFQNKNGIFRFAQETCCWTLRTIENENDIFQIWSWITSTKINKNHWFQQKVTLKKINQNHENNRL